MKKRQYAYNIVNIEYSYRVSNNTVYNRVSVVRIKRNKNNVINAI